MLTISLLPTPIAWAGMLGPDSSLTSPIPGTDHHHVRISQPQWLCGARLSLCTQVAHHPFPATEECGQPPCAHQPLQQCRHQGQLQPRPRSATHPKQSSLCLSSSAWGILLGLLGFLDWRWRAPQMRLDRRGRNEGGRSLPPLLPPLCEGPQSWPQSLASFPRIWLPVCPHRLQRP